MSIPAALRDRIKPGDVFDVTNHYIKREDHACFGTKRRVITRVNSSAFYWTIEGHDKENRQEWPKVSAFSVESDGTISLLGGGVGQRPADPFLTLVPR